MCRGVKYYPSVYSQVVLKEILVQFCLECFILDFPSSNYWTAHMRNLYPVVVCLLMVINC
jgi:hypothetical protein